MTTLSDPAPVAAADGAPDATGRSSVSRRRDRRPFVAAVVIGAGLIVAPFAFQMFGRAPQGATMLADFKPFMTTQRLNGFHADIAQIHAAARELSAHHVTSSGYAPFAAQWSVIHADMSNLLDKVSGNLGNYQAVAALPSFRLFPWFFVVPGLLIVVAGVVGLWPRSQRPARVALAVLGIGLVLAPVIFQMFTRAPKGGHMMQAFKSIETTANVETIQGYFSTMATGQGAIRLEIVPALHREGHSDAQIAGEFPAVTALDENWVHILNDMTPMIGAMSDNVPRYQAIAALPPFPLFPWFFVLPGVLVAGLGLWSSRQRAAVAAVTA